MKLTHSMAALAACAALVLPAAAADAGPKLRIPDFSNLRAKAAEDSLRGAEPTDDAIREAAELAAQAAEPQADHRGSVDYKRNVVRVFCERGLRTAISAAQAGEEGRS